MTIQAEYWYESTPEDVRREPPVPISADTQQLMFYDANITKPGYFLRLVVFENNLENPNMFNNISDAVEIQVITEEDESGCETICDTIITLLSPNALLMSCCLLPLVLAQASF